MVAKWFPETADEAREAIIEAGTEWADAVDAYRSDPSNRPPGSEDRLYAAEDALLYAVRRSRQVPVKPDA